MRVVIAGASGAFAQSIVPRLASLEEVSSLVLGGRRPSELEELGERLPVATSTTRLDVDDVTSIRNALSDADLLMNFAGPDHVAARPLLSAAIEAGVNYADLAAAAAVVGDLLSLDELAKVSGTAAVLGVGSAPGLTNLLARHATEQIAADLDITFGFLWPCPAGNAAAEEAARIRQSGGAGAAWETLLNYVSSPVAVLRDGAVSMIDPWANSTVLTVPDGGEIRGFPVGSSEPITLGRHLPTCRSARAIVGFWPPAANDLWRDAVCGRSAGATAGDVIAELHDRLVELEPEPPPPFQFGFAARFDAGSGEQTYAVRPSGSWFGTSVAAVVGAQRMLRGEVEPGVHSPEAVFSPLPYFTDAARLAGQAPGDALLVEQTS